MDKEAQDLIAKPIRFLQFTNNKEDAEREARLKEAASSIEKAIKNDKNLNDLIDYQPPDEAQFDPSQDVRPLHERLSEQKKKKLDEIEESQKMSNAISKLDEEDVQYLNEVAKSQREEEVKKRLEIYDLLEEKKRLDEKRLLEAEQKTKESLTNHTHLAKKSASPSTSKGSQSLKAKLGNKIKVKPKLKTCD